MQNATLVRYFKDLATVSVVLHQDSLHLPFSELKAEETPQDEPYTSSQHSPIYRIWSGKSGTALAVG
ncbi:hypothetical protein CCP3SC5AM1_1220010 [Gammaproteobacteria bacterium]